MSAGRKLSETKPSPKASNRVQQVKDFLSEYYEIKINVFDSSKSVIECKNKNRYAKSVTFEDLSLHMEEEGIRGCDSILKKIIASPNQIKVFNPITDFIESLEGAWKGESQIDKLCSYISVREFPGKENNFYHNRFKRLFRKWGAAAVAQIKGDHCNDVVIGFVHADEGIGKSSLIEFLVPECLSGYYQKADKDPRYFDIARAFSTNLIVNFDDNVALTKTNAEPIKSALSSLNFKLNRYFEDTMPRMASGALTSNMTSEMGGFLIPELGTRRWAIIELDTIDHEYSKAVDVQQLWAEFYLLYKNADFNYIWDADDFAEFQEFNQRYMKETNAKKLIREFYRLPCEKDKPDQIQFKQPIEILQDLRNARKVPAGLSNISEVTIGFALKASGFTKTAHRRDGDGPRYGYHVVPLY